MPLLFLHKAALLSWTEDYNVNDLGLITGHASSKSTSYDGLTDEEAEELKSELQAKEARRIPLGFAGGSQKRTKSAGRRPGTWPRVPFFDKRG